MNEIVFDKTAEERIIKNRRSAALRKQEDAYIRELEIKVREGIQRSREKEAYRQELDIKVSHLEEEIQRSIRQEPLLSKEGGGMEKGQRRSCSAFSICTSRMTLPAHKPNKAQHSW